MGQARYPNPHPCSGCSCPIGQVTLCSHPRFAYRSARIPAQLRSQCERPLLKKGDDTCNKSDILIMTILVNDTAPCAMSLTFWVIYWADAHLHQPETFVVEACIPKPVGGCIAPPLPVGGCIAAAVARQCNVTQAIACEHPDASARSGNLAWRRPTIRVFRVITLITLC